MLIKIEDENQFQKNVLNNSLLNTDRVALSEYKNKIKLKQKVDGLSEEINIMKSDISDIKTMLIQLINSKKTEN